MTDPTAAPSPSSLRALHAAAMAALLCLYAVGTCAADALPTAATPVPSATIQTAGMNLASSLSQVTGSEVSGSEVSVSSATQGVQNTLPEAFVSDAATLAEEEANAAPLRLEHVLSSLGLLGSYADDAGTPARAPSLTSILKFLFWFALLLLVSLSVRDALALFRHLLSRPPTPRPSMPYAPWPSMTVIFESHSVSRIATHLSAIARADYPLERLKILVLCPLHEPEVFELMQEANAEMPGRVVALQCGYGGDVAGRCFSAGIRFGTGELVLVLSDTLPCARGALKACAERFFDPSLGALLGFLPGAAADDKALVPRMAKLLRIASQTAGMTSAAGMTPGTGLLALRRSAVRTVGIDATRPTDCFALLRQLERFGSHHALQEGSIAAGEAVHNWEGRSRWIEACARAFAATMPLNPLRWCGRRHTAQSNFGMQGQLLRPALWGGVAVGSVVLYFTGNALAAAAGLSVCTATAYGVDGMPSAFNSTAVLFRVHGRRAEASLVAWAPVMFCHDLVIALHSGLQSLHQRATRHRAGARPFSGAAHQPIEPIEQSTLA